MQSTRSTALTSALLTLACTATATAGLAQAQLPSAFFPSEEDLHEGTWLQWPHPFTYGFLYMDDLDPTWVEMTRRLVGSERVHIIAFDAWHRGHIVAELTQAGVALDAVDFLIQPTDDCWVRDNGPIFTYAADGSLQATDWGFNGWGFDAPFLDDDDVPGAVAAALAIPTVDLNQIVLEGGAVELDGNGVLMATRSSILDPARNPGLTETELEAALIEQFGVSKFIWLDGYFGGSEDITDAHIDGFARFAAGGHLVTMSNSDLSYWGLSAADIATLNAATDATGVPFDFVELPLTQNDVVTTYGANLGFKGSYVNYYVANTVVLMPSYADPNDALARSILQGLYPDRTVYPIDVRNLYAGGGMVHCVTQQQPVADPQWLPVATSSGCGAGAMELTAFGVPDLGRVLQFVVDGIPGTATVAVLSVGQAIALPLEGGCTLLTDGVFGTLPVAFAGSSSANATLLAIPPAPSLAGLGFSTQAGALAFPQGSPAVVLSNGLSIDVLP